MIPNSRRVEDSSVGLLYEILVAFSMVHPNFDSKSDKFPQLLILFNDLPMNSPNKVSEDGKEITNEEWF